MEKAGDTGQSNAAGINTIITHWRVFVKKLTPISELPKLLKKKSKYRNKIINIDGIRFQSKKEAKYYKKLILWKKSGFIKYFLRQVPFDLPGNVKYRVDFQVFYPDRIEYIDVKGHRTKEFILKKKQVEALYPVKILEL
jgi:hypothetical protein